MSFRDKRLPFKASTATNNKTKKLACNGLTNIHAGKAISKSIAVRRNNVNNKGNEVKGEEESLWRVCESCRLLLTTSREYVKCCRELLANARLLFLDDVQHHHRGVEAWERVLQALDAAHLPS